MKWRRINRILFWPESKHDIEHILSKRRTRLEFYDFKNNIKWLCKQTKLDVGFYNTVVNYPLKSGSFYFIEKHFPVTAFLVKVETDVDIYRKMQAFITFFRVSDWFIYFNDESFYELWQLFKNAPFWKDYAVWKKLHNMNEDF